MHILYSYRDVIIIHHYITYTSVSQRISFVSLSRRYCRWFGSKGDASPKLASYALNTYLDWEAKIEEWQNPILSAKYVKEPEKYQYLCGLLTRWYAFAFD